MDSKTTDSASYLTSTTEDYASGAAAGVLPPPPPPSYQASTNDIPNLNLSFTPVPPPPHPITVLMTGESRSPNFTVTIPPGPNNVHGTIPLAEIDTDSTLIHHHTHIKDVRPGGVMYTLKRQTLSGSGPEMPASVAVPLSSLRQKAKTRLVRGLPGGPADRTPSGEWRYTITGHGREGKRLLEITTTPEILGVASTRLVFRRADDGELDALRLKTHAHGEHEGGLAMVVEYQGARIGEIVLLEGKREKPVLRIAIEAAGVDPLLMVVLALVVDDRWMGEKRRFKREFGRGWTGIGKGPGAGLAGAYALGSV